MLKSSTKYVLMLHLFVNCSQDKMMLLPFVNYLVEKTQEKGKGKDKGKDKDKEHLKAKTKIKES